LTNNTENYVLLYSAFRDFLTIQSCAPESLNDMGKTCVSGMVFQSCEVLLTPVKFAFCHENRYDIKHI